MTTTKKYISRFDCVKTYGKHQYKKVPMSRKKCVNCGKVQRTSRREKTGEY